MIFTGPCPKCTSTDVRLSLLFQGDPANPAIWRLLDDANRHLRNPRECLLYGPQRERIVSPTYFVTFTTDPRKRYARDLPAFQAEVEGQLRRRNIASAYYCIEHIDTNMHAHCLIKATGRGLSDPAKDWKFMHNKVGMVRVDLVRKDNGIADYMAKENPIWERVGDYPNFEFRTINLDD